MKNLWYGAAATAVTFCGGWFGTDALRSNGNAHYSFWVCPLGFCAYASAVIAVLSLVCGLYDIRFPDLGRRRPQVLDESELIRIRRISDEPGSTRAQKQPLYEFYLRRRIRISGTVVDVGEWTGSSSRVKVRTNVGGFTAFMYFSDKSTFVQHLRMLPPETHLTAIGKIKDIESNKITLVNCEIVHDAPWPSAVI
jgi:hypothetical protein